MNGSQHISQEDLALYAMQALSGEQAESMRLHLADCEACYEQLAALNGDLALLALTVARRPVPQDVRQRFMQKLAIAGPAVGTRQTVSVVPIESAPVRRRASWVPWLAAAALLALTAGLGMRIKQLSDQLQTENDQVAKLTEQNQQLAETNAHAQEVLEVLTAPHAQRAVLTAAMVKPVPTGRAVYLAQSGALIFQGSNLARLPEGKTYELWLIPTSGAPIPAGLFKPDARGAAAIIHPPLPTGVEAKAFAITVEPEAGSSAPTSAIIMVGSGG